MAKYKATRNFHHDQLGSIKKNHQFEASDAQVAPVKQWVTAVDGDEGGEKYATKVTHEEPAGGDTSKTSKNRNK